MSRPFGSAGPLRAAVGATAALLLLSLLPVAAASSTAPGPPAAAVTLGRLRADGRFLRDDEGRAVVLRGFNVSQKTAPYVPTWLTDDDAALMASLGANVARVA